MDHGAKAIAANLSPAAKSRSSTSREEARFPLDEPARCGRSTTASARRGSRSGTATIRLDGAGAPEDVLRFLPSSASRRLRGREESEAAKGGARVECVGALRRPGRGRPRREHGERRVFVVSHDDDPRSGCSRRRSRPGSGSMRTRSRPAPTRSTRRARSRSAPSADAARPRRRPGRRRGRPRKPRGSDREGERGARAASARASAGARRHAFREGLAPRSSPPRSGRRWNQLVLTKAQWQVIVKGAKDREQRRPRRRRAEALGALAQTGSTIGRSFAIFAWSSSRDLGADRDTTDLAVR